MNFSYWVGNFLSQNRKKKENRVLHWITFVIFPIHMEFLENVSEYTRKFSWLCWCYGGLISTLKWTRLDFRSTSLTGMLNRPRKTFNRSFKLRCFIQSSAGVGKNWKISETSAVLLEITGKFSVQQQKNRSCKLISSIIDFNNFLFSSPSALHSSLVFHNIIFRQIFSRRVSGEKRENMMN